jgi:hypothetical protein
VQRIGELLGPAQRGGDRKSAEINSGKNEMKPQAEMDRDHQARLLAAYPEVVDARCRPAGSARLPVEASDAVCSCTIPPDRSYSWSI